MIRFQSRGTPLADLPAPVVTTIEHYLDVVSHGTDIYWFDASPHPQGAGRWKRPLTYVRFCHGARRDVSHIWVRDDNGRIVGSGTAR